jgi:SAM-dependent methyltransferase
MNLKAIVKNALPRRWYDCIGVTTARHGFFGMSRYCPVCGSLLAGFLPYGGRALRSEALCPVCGSLERHRLMSLYFRAATDIWDRRPKTVLHVAPEPAIARLLCQARFLHYVSADLSDPGAMLHVDITNIPVRANVFDIILCSHVLEHIPDDRRAMSELLRVLKPGGWAMLQVPICGDDTIEDPSAGPDERERRFGRHDHVRSYGKDYPDRLRAAGFLVTVDPFVRNLGRDCTRCCGLQDDEDLYIGHKPAE